MKKIDPPMLIINIKESFCWLRLAFMRDPFGSPFVSLEYPAFILWFAFRENCVLRDDEFFNNR